MGFSGVLRGEGSKGKFSQIISAGSRLINTLKEKAKYVKDQLHCI